MERYLLYIDILGFRDMVMNNPEKVEKVYQVLDRLNAHNHSDFKGIIFSDTILIYLEPSLALAKSREDHDYVVMYMCEFARDLLYRTIGHEITFRALITQGDFNTVPGKHALFFHGEALIRAYEKEKKIPAIGLFLDSRCVGDTIAFPSVPYDDEYHVVYLLQSLETIYNDYQGKIPIDKFVLEETDDLWIITYDLGHLEFVYRNMLSHPISKVRKKYKKTWSLYNRRYKKILSQLVGHDFKPNFLCPEYDWTEKISAFKTLSIY